MICRVSVLFAVALIAGPANAATIAIENAHVHTMGAAGSLRSATVVIDDGTIVAVGENVTVPVGTRRIDASGMIVTPGLISPVGQLGLVEVNAVPGTVDSVQRGDQFAAGFDVADAFNPRSTLIAVNRIEGVTSAVVVPKSAAPDAHGNNSHVLSGLGSVVHLGDAGESIARRGAVMVVNFGEAGSQVAGGSRAAAMMILRAAIDDALDYRVNKAAHERGDWREYSVSTADLKALSGVLERRIPLLVDANRASDISAIIKLGADYGIRIIVLGGAEAWMLASDLAAADIAVILDAPGNLPTNFDRLNARLESAAILSTAGVAVSFGAGFAQTHNARNLTQSAGLAVANGLDWDSALAALTITPARMYGMDASLGSIEVGKRADLVLWRDDPLELTSFPEQVYIDGQAIPMQSRQTLLRDRYLDSESGRPPAFRH